MILDREALGAMLLQAAKLLEENTQYLSDIDSRFGDGDHGITMGKIAKLIQERVPQWGEDSIKDFLDSLGMAIMEVKGGSAGPLYGTMIGGLGVNLDDDAGQVDEAGLKAMFAGCLTSKRRIIHENRPAIRHAVGAPCPAGRPGAGAAGDRLRRSHI